jgi:hypothetical protein
VGSTHGLKSSSPESITTIEVDGCNADALIATMFEMISQYLRFPPDVFTLDFHMNTKIRNLVELTPIKAN